ncbi:hypothetical protein CGCTS75_v000324 [Colletotrichum tropicale]|nr:hypothetical protein CGCTS75_v000324 [Colletotrichum tropicale]
MARPTPPASTSPRRSSSSSGRSAFSNSLFPDETFAHRRLSTGPRGLQLRLGLEADYMLTFPISQLDFRTPKASLSPRRRISATKFVWVGSGARSSDLPEHRLSNTQDIDTPVRSILGDSILWPPAATIDDAEDDVSEIS